jgi:hypothetical protein
LDRLIWINVSRVERYLAAKMHLRSMEVDVNTTLKSAIGGVFGTLIGIAVLSMTAGAQQSPGATTTAPPATQVQPSTSPTTSQTTPAQPGPAMGHQMMQQGQGMGMGMGGQMMHMGQQMRTMGQRMMSGHATSQQQQQMGRQMMDMSQQMENMGHQMPAEQGNVQAPMQGHR